MEKIDSFRLRRPMLGRKKKPSKVNKKIGELGWSLAKTE